MENRRPDIVVGIDIGQTCSGVAYSIGPDWTDPKILRSWPGYYGTRNADKVATRVGYDKSRPNQLKNWGFSTVFEDDTVHVREQFKLTLDAEYEDDRGFSCVDARQWYSDYLGCLHRKIESFFDSTIDQWRSMNVEYSFSTPTTWKNPAMIASIKKLVESAGFASTPQQTVRMSLTEAEAAAIEASTTQYKVGDIFLICDAGGGTTDVNLLKVKTIGKSIKLDPLNHVEGVPIGSTLIDYAMAQHIVKRLEPIQEHLEGDILGVADEMLQDRFQTVKHSFPDPVVDHFWLDIKSLAGSQSFPEAGIKNSRMAIERTTIQEIFDQQVSRIFKLMDERLLAMQQICPDEPVAYIILSGGLGSSPYLYKQIQKRYEDNSGFTSKNTQSTRIMKVIEPQLAVVRGLVRERTQQLGGKDTPGKEVFTARRCRNSYGVIVREVFEESKHKDLGIEKSSLKPDPIDGELYVENCVDWFIKKGEEIDVNAGVSQRYRTVLPDEDKSKTRSAQIVLSTAPAGRLPRMRFDASCQDVVAVKYKLTENDMKLKNRQIWKLKKQYWRANFEFVVKVGSADLRFQIRGNEGILSTDHDKLDVDFFDPLEILPHPPQQNGAANSRAEQSPAFLMLDRYG